MTIGTDITGARPVLQADERNPQKVGEAATQFEALLIEQMMRTMRESAKLGSDEDQSSACVMEMAEQQFSRVMSANGGFGLANLVVAGLHKPAQTAIAE